MSKQESKYEKPLWLKTPIEEVEALIEKLSKEGYTNEKIGLILRDQYGIPTIRVYGKKISEVLKEKGILSNSDLTNIQKKLDRVRNHLKRHQKDRKTKRILEIRTARLRKIQAYSKKLN